MFNIMIVGYSSLYSTKLANNLWQSLYVSRLLFQLIVVL